MSSSSTVAVQVASLAVAFAATMISMWSFTQAHLVWGAYNLVIALVALVVVVAARARDDQAPHRPD